MSQPDPAAARFRLDALNFLLADVRDGIGPFLFIYLQTQPGWTPARIGAAAAVMGLASVVAQLPAGWLIDRLAKARLFVVAFSVVVGVCSLAMVLRPAPEIVFPAQVLLGLAAAILGPATATLTLALVGHRAFGRRTSRSEVGNHAGNLVAALLAGLAGSWLGHAWIFYLGAFFSFASAAVGLALPAQADAPLPLPSAEPPSRAADSAAWRELFADRRVVSLAAVMLLFHLSNAAQLPIVGLVLARAHPEWDAFFMSSCIVVAQLVMMAVAAGVGWAMQRRWGRKPLLLLALAVLPLRAWGYTLTDDPRLLLAIQALDGVAAGILDVLTIVLAADLAGRSGHFNFLQSLLLTTGGVGAALSNLGAGWLAGRAGTSVAFVALSFAGLLGLALGAWLLPETRASDDPTPALPPTPAPSAP